MTLLQLRANTSKTKAKTASQANSLDGGRAQRSVSSKIAAKPLVLHDHAFQVALAPESVRELREWIVKAAYGQQCPPGFSFPAVDQALSNAWITAYKVMDGVKDLSPCALWSEAVVAFSKRMRIDSPGYLVDINNSVETGGIGEVFSRAMNHREAEGGVLLSLTDASARAATDVLHLDPTWLIELVRRLADHNLVDKNEKKQGTLKGELREYASQKHVELAPLWDMHR